MVVVSLAYAVVHRLAPGSTGMLSLVGEHRCLVPDGVRRISPVGLVTVVMVIQLPAAAVAHARCLICRARAVHCLVPAGVGAKPAKSVTHMCLGLYRDRAERCADACTAKLLRRLG